MQVWTEEQENAIAARNTNLLVSAAAGSGKTAVLVERIIQLIIKDKVNIDRLLVVTFTHAAAGEMRERISAALIEELEKQNENEAHLVKQINLLNRAAISTIHAFCIDVVKKYFHLIYIDPNFRIGDTTETSIMKLEALEELLESEYAQEDPAFLKMVEMFGGGKDDSPLENLVLKAYEFIQSKPNPLEWLANRAEDFNLNEEEFARCPWIENIARQLRINLLGARDFFSQALAITVMPQGPIAYQPAILADINIVDQLLEVLGQGLPLLYEQLATIEYARLSRVSKDTDVKMQEEVKELRAQGKKVIDTIRSKLVFQNMEQFRQDLNEIYPEMKYLAALVNSYTQVYRDKKNDKGILDFNDLEHYALEILTHQQVAAEYKRKYDYIFVDEYQDSNLVQEIILNSIKQQNNLFLVGDVKQSIYRFRLADPSLFMDKYNSFPNDSQGPDQRIDLRKNFRSRKEIIDGINCIFRQIMSSDFGEIDYDENAYLYPGVGCSDAVDLMGSEQNMPSMELLLIEKKRDIPEIDINDIDMAEADIEEPGAWEIEAQVVAARIQELYGQLFYDSKQACYRTMEYRDIVILMRATRQSADIFADTFRTAGIPVYADVDKGYFQTLEINIFINLLKIIDNKRHIPLLSVLRSPIGRFTLEDLIAMRVESQAPTYYEAAEEYLARHNDDLQVRLKHFFDRLDTWKDAARYTSMDDLIWKLLQETGYYYYVGAMPGGLQRQANLRVLLDRAGQFQTTSLKGLFQFIKFVDKLQAGSGDMGMAKILGENDNVVRIMSIHKSKGLEFPAVILAGMGNGFNLNDTRAPILFHKDLGIGPYYINPELRVNKETVARIAMKNLIKMESMAEEMRILYVACTRPRDKLIMVGSLSDLPRRVKIWSKKISTFQLAQAKCYLDWVGPVALRHQDGLKLQALAKIDLDKSQLAPEIFSWRLEIVNRRQTAGFEGQLSVKEEEFKNLLLDFQPAAKSPEQEMIGQRLSWQYPHAQAVSIPSKLSVSQIKNMPGKMAESPEQKIPPLQKHPRFMNTRETGTGGTIFSGAEKGSIMHFVMQHLDFQGLEGEADVAAQIQTMVDHELLGEEEARQVNIDSILNFFSSDLGQRVLKAGKVYREVPFNLVCRAADIAADWVQCDDKLLIQGVIDLYFWEGEEMVLLDYKTDRITLQNREGLINTYRMQLELYKNALERIQGHPVKDSYLYLFDCEEAVRL